MGVTGTRVLGGRYALAEVLGDGGMATVYRAGDQVLGREVAVKVLSPRYAADPGFLARFEREARHMAALSHPRIVTVFDCGIDGGTPFIVMELVAGRTLRQVLDEAGPLPAGQAAAIAAAVCEALQAAHGAGLVHRDITPANIVLSGGQVKVLEFGIARVPGRGTGPQPGTLPAAAAAFTGALQAGVADGQVAQQAGQNLFGQLDQLLFGPPGRNLQQIGQQYAQLVQSYDQDQSQGQITGPAAAAVRRALDALGIAVGAL